MYSNFQENIFVQETNSLVPSFLQRYTAKKASKLHNLFLKGKLFCIQNLGERTLYVKNNSILKVYGIRK